MPKLTEGYAAKLVVPSGKRDIQVFDDALPGFGIRKFESGRAFYFVKFAVGKQQRKLSLGPVVPGVFGDTRKRAAEILTRARIGQDVVAEKREAAAKPPRAPLGPLVAKYLRDRESGIRAATYVEFNRYLLRYWKPLHEQAIDKIQRRDIVSVLDEIADQHGKTSADRARTALSAFFAWAIDRGYLDLNPVQNIAPRAQNAARSRVLSEAELSAVWKACGDDDHGRIVRLLLLTGQRRSEIGDLDWKEVSLDKRQIDLPETRTKNGRAHIVPLSDEAVSLLSSAPRQEMRQHVFGVGLRGFQGWSKAKLALDSRLPKDMSVWTLHDIRRSVVTHLHELGFAQPHVVEAIVNHVSGHRAGVAGVYNKALYQLERRRALDLWGQHMSALVEGRPSSVVTIKVTG